MGALLDRLSWPVVGLLALTLGLAPFTPEPHLLEKLRLLRAGALVQPIDIFDLALHGAPWIVLAAKAARTFARRGS